MCLTFNKYQWYIVAVSKTQQNYKERSSEMTNSEELKKAIKEAGVSVVFLAKYLKCSRNRIYSIINGADCTASEINAFTHCLHLSNERRDLIFLTESVS